MNGKRSTKVSVQLPRVPVGKRSKSVQDEFWQQQGSSGALNAYRQLTSSMHKGGRKQAALPGGKLQPLFKNYTAPAKLNGSQFGSTKNVLPGISMEAQSDNASQVQHVVSGCLSDLPSPQPSTVRVYLASNHQDMKVERQALLRKAVPELQQFCSQQGLLFQLVDLQWGLQDDHCDVLGASRVRRHQEIADCQRLSLGPNFVALLGDRYGPQQLMTEIPEAEYDILQSVAVNRGLANAELLTKCYLRDQNAVPPTYVLQGLEVETVVEPLCVLLREAAHVAMDEGKMTLPAAKNFFVSGLEQDLSQGIFASQNPRSHCLAYRREFRHLSQQVDSPEAATYLDTVLGGGSGDGVQLDTERQTLHHELCEQVKQHLGVGNSREYFVGWDGKKSHDSEPGSEFGDYLDKLCADFCADMQHLILQGLQKDLNSPNKKAGTAVYEEVLHHANMWSEKVACAQGQGLVLAKLEKFLRDPQQNTKPFVIHGQPDTGKTVTMAMVARQLKDWFTSDCVVILRFLGTTTHSCSIHNVVTSITLQICMAYSLKLPNVDQECNTLFKALTTMRSVLDKVSKSFAFIRPLFIVLDGLDHLQPYEDSLRALWAIKDLPTNVHIVVSTLPQLGKIELLTALLTLVTDEEASMEVQPLSHAELNNLLQDHGEKCHRKLMEQQHTAITQSYSQTNSPLHLNILLQESKSWRSYQENHVISEVVTEALGTVLNTLEVQLGCNIVSFFAAYVSAVPVGVQERELLDLMSMNRDVMQEVTDIHSAELEGVNYFPPRLLATLKQGLRGYLVEHSVYGSRALAWAHRSYLHTVAHRYLVIYPGMEEEAITDDATSFTLMLHEHMANLYLNDSKLGGLGSHDSIENSEVTVEMPQPLLPVNHLKLHRLPIHLKVMLPLEGLHRISELMLFNYEWNYAKMKAGCLQETMRDILGIFTLVRQLEEQGIEQENSNPGGDLDLLFEFLHLAEPALARDPDYLVYEIWGRLASLAETNPAIKILVDAATQWAESTKKEMLVPVFPTLTAPGGLLRHTLPGPTHFVGSLQVGQIAVMFSRFSGVDVWRLDTGELLQRFPVNKEQDVANIIPGNTAEFVIIGHFSYLNNVQDLSVWSSETGVRLVQSTFPRKFDTFALNSTDNLLMVATVVENTEGLRRSLVRCLLGVDVHTKEILHTMPISDVHAEGITNIFFVNGTGDDGSSHTENLLTLGTEKTKDLALWKLTTEEVEYRMELSHFPDLTKLDTDHNILVGANVEHGVIFMVNVAKGEVTCKLSGDALRKLSDIHLSDGHVLVATHSDGIHRYATDGGSLVGSFGQPEVGVVDPPSVMTSLDSHLFVGYESGDIRLYHLSSGECLTSLEAHTARINTLNCVMDKWLVSASSDEQTRVWNLQHLLKSLEEKSPGRVAAGPGEQPTAEENVSCCVVTADGGEVWTGSWTGPVKVWDMDSGRLKRELSVGSCAGVSDMYWAYKGQLLVGHGVVPGSPQIRQLQVWRAEKGELAQFAEGSVLVYCSCVFPEGQDRLLTLSPSMDDQHPGLLVGIYDLFDMKCVNVLHCNIFGSMNSSNLSLLGFTSYTQAESAVISTLADAQAASAHATQAHDPVTKMQKLYAILDYYPQPGMSFFFTFVVDGSSRQKISMDHHEPIHLDTQSPKCSVVMREGCCVSGGVDGSLVAWDVATQNVIAHVYDHSLAKAVREGHVTSQHRLSHKPAHEGPITCVALSADCRLMVSGAVDHKVKIWLLGDRQLVHVLSAHTDQISSLSISPDNSIVATGSHDHSLILWQADSAEKLTSFYTHYPISSITTVPDKHKMVLELADSKPRLSILKMLNFT